MTATRPNLTAVARAAGVSPASVSNAYNRPDQLSEAVRARIFAVAEELGYAGPDPAARSLRSRRSDAIGVLFTTGLSYAFSDPYAFELLRGVAEVAEPVHTSLVLLPLPPHTAPLDAEATRESVQAVRRAVVDGVIADGIDDRHPALGVLRSRGVPLVRTTDDAGARCVLIDDTAAGRLVGEHLAALGHRDVAVVADSAGGDPRALAEFDGASDASGTLLPYGRARLHGIRAGLGPDARLTVVAAGPNAAASGGAAAALLLDGDTPPTAIVAVTDVLALGALDALRERGLEPGRDVSVTGFDDVPAAARAGLTTVHQPVFEKGRVMGRMLLDPSFTDRRVVLPMDLVVRATTGPRTS